MTLALGCDQVATQEESAGACAAAEQCGQALGCTYGYCVEPLEEQVVLQARVMAPPGSPFLEQQVPQLTLTGEPALTVQLMQTAELSGVVRNAGDAFVSNLPGELTARAPGDIPGLDYRFTARSSDGLDASGEGYTLRLLPGRSYEVSFRPDDKAIPPHVFTLDASEVVTGPFDIALPALNDYVKLAGWVQWPSGKPIEGCKVTVLLDDGRALPSMIMDTMQAAFDLRLPPGTDSVRIRVEAPEDGALFPTFLSEPFEPSDNIEVVLPAPPENHGPRDAEIHVVRVDAKGVEVPLSGVNLVLSGTLDAGAHTETAMTDESGVATVHILPGTYEVIAASPPGQDYGTLRTTLSWEEGPESVVTEPHRLTLPNRPLVQGTIRSAGGQPVVKGQVQARRRLAPEESASLAISPAPFMAQIDPSGAYSMHVDEGTYDLSVVPDASSGAPPVQQQGLIVSESMELNFELPSPSLARITVQDPDGLLLSDVTVELYLSDEAAEQARVLVKGTTDEHGVVDLLVPHSL